jgi:hypothetical protein
MSQAQVTTRSREQVARFFAGADLVEPGIVLAEEWQPDHRTADDTVTSSLWCGVGRKR